MARINMEGQTFGRLIVLRDVGRDNNRQVIWLCSCECGNEKEISRKSLINGHTRSCGCFLKDSARERSTIHGMSRTRIYITYNSMKQRCYNEKHEEYHNYGARGIKVCERWHDFNNFYIDMKDGYSDSLTLDRIDVNGNYEPSNCKWSTPLQQVNNRRNNIIVQVDGERMTLKEACDILKLNYNTIHERVRKGWEPQKAIEVPIKHMKQRSA